MASGAYECGLLPPIAKLILVLKMASSRYVTAISKRGASWRIRSVKVDSLICWGDVNGVNAPSAVLLTKVELNSSRSLFELALRPTHDSCCL